MRVVMKTGIRIRLVALVIVAVAVADKNVRAIVVGKRSPVAEVAT